VLHLKRIILLFTLFVSGFTLTGCDLIPTDAIPDDLVDGLTEELCREDPENELCSITDLNDVSETIAEELVLDAITVLKDTNSDVCDTVFSITNTDLLDACKDGTLLPEGVTEFNVITASQEGAVYVFQGSTGTDMFHEVRVTYGDVEGNMRITSLTFTEIEDPTPVAELTDEEFIRKFFADYQDSSITFEDLNALYFNGLLTTEDETDREETLTSGMTYEVTAVRMIDSTSYDITFTITDGTETETETTVFHIVTIDGTRYLEFGDDNTTDEGEIDPGELLSVEEFTTLFEEFILDYLDDSLTNDDLANKWFEFLDEDFRSGRTNALSSDTTILLKEVLSLGDNRFEITVEFNDAGSVDTDVSVIQVYLYDGRQVIAFEDKIDDDCNDAVDECHPDDYLFGTELQNALEKYFMDYGDDTISNQEFANEYFGGELSSDFATARDADLVLGFSFDIQSITEFDDGAFVVEYTVFEGEDKVLRKRPGRIRYTSDSLLVEWDQLIDEHLETDLAFVTTFFEQFLVDYLNPAVTDDMLQADYFGDEDMNWFYEQRANDLEDGLSIQLDMMEPVDNMGIFVATLTFNDGNETFQQEVEIKIKRIDAATPLLYFIDGDTEGDGIPIGDVVEAEQLLRNFVMDYNDTSKSNDDLMMKYGLYESFSVLDQRLLDQENGTILTFGMLTLMSEWGEGVYEVTFYTTTPDQPEETRVKVVLLVRYQDQTMIYFDGEDNDCDGMTDECDVVTDSIMAQGYMETFLSLYNDPMVTMEQLYPYVYGYLSLLDDRDMDLLEGIEWSVVSVEAKDNFVFNFKLEHIHSEGVVHRDIAVRMYHRGSMVMIEEAFVQEMFYETDLTLITPFVEELFASLNDTTLSSDQIIDTFFDGYAPYEFFELRDSGAVYVFRSLELIMMGDPDMYPFMFLLTYDVQIGEMTTTYSFDTFFWKQDGGLIINALVPYEGDIELEMAIYMFFDNVSMPDVPFEEVCKEFDESSKALCNAITNFHRDNGYMVYADELIYQEDGSYLVHTTTVSENGDVVENNTFVFRYSATNPLYEAKTTEGNNPLYEG
jgi:hypothetical protein